MPNYFRFFHIKASLKYPKQTKQVERELCIQWQWPYLQSTVYKITTPPLGKVTFDYVKVVYIADNKGGSTMGIIVMLRSFMVAEAHR